MPDTKLVQVRVSTETYQRFTQAAGARHFTQAQYLEALMDLHEAARAYMLNTSPKNSARNIAREIMRLGLAPVTT